MIVTEKEVEILRLYFAEKWRVGTIGRQLGVHHDTVERVLREAGVSPTHLPRRPSIIDPYVPLIIETFKQYPTLRSSRLYQMARERGFSGQPDHFRHVVARYRPRPAAEAYLRLRTLPGEQAQVDWAFFGRVLVENTLRMLVAFVMVLSFSRLIFLRFGLCQRMGAFLACHQDAFDFFGGVPRVLLYDNLKSAVLERIGAAIRFNPTLLCFAAHHRYEPRPVAPYRGNEKGRAERAIRYVRESFFPARTWTDLDDLNAQARAWCLGWAADRRCPEDRSRTVREVFEDERPRLLPLPQDRFPAEDNVVVKAGKTPYVRFDLNDYSIPHDRTRRALTVVASQNTVRVLDGLEVIASHDRSWGKGRQIEDPTHIQALADQKHEAAQGRGMDRLQHAAPHCRALLCALAERGANMGGCVARLLRLLDQHGAQELDLAVAEALDQGAPHLHGVQQILERRRHEQDKPPPIPVHLPDDPRVRDLVVKPHDLATYDALGAGHDDDEEDHHG
ncbi:MAG: IS21 family transposase [Myxococcota bacterium]|nr:IS21 family transposase [Myxococcota bacterium]